MKKYLFGLGTMVVGAGLMFVLMHGEVSADNTEVNTKDAFVKDLKEFKETSYCDFVDIGNDSDPEVLDTIFCKFKNKTCFTFGNNLICDKESWLFK